MTKPGEKQWWRGRGSEKNSGREAQKIGGNNRFGNRGEEGEARKKKGRKSPVMANDSKKKTIIKW